MQDLRNVQAHAPGQLSKNRPAGTSALLDPDEGMVLPLEDSTHETGSLPVEECKIQGSSLGMEDLEDLKFVQQQAEPLAITSPVHSIKVRGRTTWLLIIGTHTKFVA